MRTPKTIPSSAKSQSPGRCRVMLLSLPSAQQAGTGERPQLAAQWLRGCDQQVAQLAETGALGVDRPFARGHQGLQRLALTARPRRRGSLACEHTSSGADSIERVGLAARASLPPQPAHLEHLLTR
jgi:hypothetical protein